MALEKIWIDYTRRNDPVCEQGFLLFEKALKKSDPLPRVVCFWTKNPKGLGEVYAESIDFLKKKGVLILCQATVNPGYQELLEKGVSSYNWEMESFISSIGGPDHVRLRFDPVIPSFSTLEMFHKHCCIAREYGIKETTINFFVPEYKQTGKRLSKILGFSDFRFSKEEKVEFLNKALVIAKDYGLSVHGCAEIKDLIEEVPGMLPAACADPNWPKKLGYDWTFLNRPSRKGCGCCYSGDWGYYRSWKGGYKCPHQCEYCYAK